MYLSEKAFICSAASRFLLIDLVTILTHVYDVCEIFLEKQYKNPYACFSINILSEFSECLIR